MHSHSSMNHPCDPARNKRPEGSVADPGTVRGKGKRPWRWAAVGVQAAAVAALIWAASVQAEPPAPTALPTGGQVAPWQATINQAGSRMTIDQTTQKAVLNWQTFNIGQNAEVRFNQPGTSSVALNRVLSSDPSRIYGNLFANGQVFLLNPNGVVFGPSARVDVGALGVSTLGIKDNDFLTGRYFFEKAAGAGGIANDGRIQAADGGYVAFIAPRIENRGEIIADRGMVAMAAGDKVSLDFSGDKLINFTIEKGAVDALIENRQLIRADEGTVILSAKAADSLSTAVVNNGGIIEARALTDKGGRILLLSDMEHGTVQVSGTLDASAPNGGDGGFIETSAAKVKVADSARVTTLSPYGKTGRWLIDPTDYTIAASEGDITGAALSTNLATTDVTILSSSGAKEGNGDIFVEDAVSWSANTTLTLSALRDINVNADITATGNTAGLTLTPNTGGAGGSYSLGNGARITLSGATPGLSIAGQAYTVIDSLGLAGDLSTTTLQGMKNNPGGRYALGSDIEAGVTSVWEGGAGFMPIGTTDTPFTGIFAGLGHEISGLAINRPAATYVGLFGSVGEGGFVTNVGLANASVSGALGVGGLAGGNKGTIENAFATGSVNGVDAVGGLVGYNLGTIRNSNSSANVSGTGGVGGVGGLVGYNEGTIRNSSSTGTASGTGIIGGLVGHNEGTIRNSDSEAVVSGDIGIGGLVGFNGGTVKNSHSGGSVTGTEFVGGLVGFNTGTIEDSHNAGSVKGKREVGGLVGRNTGEISDSFNKGKVKGRIFVGGLVGMNEETVSGSYNEGKVKGRKGVGGLVGINEGAIGASHNTGKVEGRTFVGGLAGVNSGTIGDSYSANSVSGNEAVGGLVGGNGGAIMDSRSTGDVRGREAVGGLVGDNGGTVEDSCSTGMVDGDSVVGGLVGYNQGTICGSYSTGSVRGRFNAGGLAGVNGGEIGDSYSTGSVEGYNVAGGLVGLNGGTISDSYSAGNVSGRNAVGGLVGANQGEVDNSHYDVDQVLINGVKQVSLGGLYGAQYQDWVVDVNLDIANYSATLPLTNGYYTISNVQGMKDLLGFSDNPAYQFRLGADVDLSTASGLYVPVFNAAEFDGAGHTISNVSIDFPEGFGIGLFGSLRTGSTVQNVGLTNVNVNGRQYVGGLVGVNEGTVRNSYTTGTVSGDDHVGGLAGWNTGEIADSYSTAVVNGSYGVGGLVGVNEGTIGNSYGAGTVTGDGNVGGLVGYNEGTIWNSYSTGDVNGDDRVGGLVGYNEGTVGNSHYDVDHVLINGVKQVSLGGLYGAQFQDWVVDLSLDIADYSATLPLTDGYYTISSVQGMKDLLGFSDNPAYKFRLGADIDLSVASGLYIPIFNAAEFDGAGHTISNLNIDFSAGYRVGLFGSVGNGSAVKNVGLTDITVNARQYVGGLVGYNQGTITNAHTAGRVNGNEFVGGLAGWSTGEIANASSTAEVTGYDIVGGLAGGNEGTISSSYGTGAVSGYYETGGLVGYNQGTIDHAYSTGSVNGDNYVGGLVGYNHGTIDHAYSTGNVSGGGYIGGLVGSNDGTIGNAYGTGSVSGSDYIGGLVGYNEGTIDHAYSTGGVSGTNYIGGLAGFNREGATIDNSYSTGHVNASGTVGGLVGQNWGVVSNSHYDIDNVLINGTKQVSLGGLYGAQYQDWVVDLTLDISNYSATLPLTDGYYTISSVEGMKDLLGFSDNPAYKFRLGADIDLFDANGLYIPVFNAAEFDGAGHTISNLNIVIPAGYQIGMFGSLGNGSVVKNVGLTNASVSGSDYVGGLVGQNWGTVSNSYTTGTVSGGNYIGGLTGWNRGEIDSAYTTAEVYGNALVGGLAGASDGTVKKSYSTGSVSGVYEVGGLVGQNEGTVRNSYSLGDVNAREGVVGGLVGTNVGKVINSYAKGGVSGSDYVGGLAGINAGTIRDSHNTGNVEGTDNVGGLTGYNEGTIENSHNTGRVRGKKQVGGLAGINAGTIDGSYNTGRVKGKKQVGGLAGINEGAIGASYNTGNVKGKEDVGGLIGNNTGTVVNSYNTGNVNGRDDVGGLIGDNDGEVGDSYSTGSVTGVYDVGGLVGYNGGAIVASHGTGIVTGDEYVGGLVGYNGGEIRDSYSTGSVTGGGDVGGLAGENWGEISKSYSTGNVTGEANVGGLVGYNGYGGEVDDAYSTGSVTGSSGVGGLVGYNWGKVRNSHSTGSVTGDEWVGGLIGYYGGKVTNSHYDIDQGLINGVKHASPGGLYGAQYQDWVVDMTLDIADYSATLPLVGGYYTISDVQGMKDLLGFAENRAYKFRLGTDIDLSQASGLYIPIFNAAEFDGAGHTIANLNIDIPGRNIGMFGSLGDGSIVKNVGLTDVNVRGRQYVGGLVGYNQGTIDHVYSTGSVNGNDYVGGLVGYNRGTIDHAYSTVGVSGDGDVGGLIGDNQGTVVNSYSTGTVAGGYEVGGLVGYNEGTIGNSHSTGNVTGDESTGGLVGSNYGIITNSYSTGGVTGNTYLGGLVGTNFGGVENSHYDIDHVLINGANQVSVGGLYGAQYQDWFVDMTLDIADYSATLPLSDGYYRISSVQGMRDLLGFADNAAYKFALGADIDLSQASGLYIPVFNAPEFDGAGHTISNLSVDFQGLQVGLFGLLGEGSIVKNTGLTHVNVRGLQNVGGLVGVNWGEITNSYSTGNVSGDGYQAGGLVGTNWGDISNSYSAGSVTGDYEVGGLVGRSVGRVSNSYSTASVTGAHQVGGLVGTNWAEIVDSYSTGAVNGLGNTGGLVAYNRGTVSNSFWDITTSGQTGSAGGTGLTTAQMRQSASFSGWDISGQGGEATLWRIYEGRTAPLLRSFLTPLTVTADDVAKTYDANGYTRALTNARYSVEGADTSGHLFNLANPYNGAVNAGTYGPDLYSDQQGYDVSYVQGLLTVNPAVVNLSGSRAYDGTVTVEAGIFTLGDLIGNETLALTGAGTVGDKNVGRNKPVNLGTLTLVNGTGLAGNYTFTGGTHKADITPKVLSGSIIGTPEKVYDGNTVATLSAANYSIIGWIGTEGATVTRTDGIYNSKDVVAADTVTVNLSETDYAAAEGTLLGNYKLPTTVGGAGTITPRIIALRADDKSKTQNSSDPAFTYGTTGLQGSDTVEGVLTGSLARPAGEGVGSYPITRGTLTSNSNYNLTFNTGTFTITPVINAPALPQTFIAPGPGPAGPGLSFSPPLLITQSGGLEGQQGPTGPSGLGSGQPGQQSVQQGQEGAPNQAEQEGAQ